MVDPNDYLHVQLRVGSGLCQVTDLHGRDVLACHRRSDKAAMRDLREFVEQVLAERVKEPAP